MKSTRTVPPFPGVRPALPSLGLKMRVVLPVLLAATVTLTACGSSEPEGTPTTGNAETLVVVGGTPITRSDVFAHVGHDDPMQGPIDGLGIDHQDTDHVLEELINLELLRQEAVTLGIDQESDVRMILRSIETNLLASQVLERKTAELQISDAAIEDEYANQVRNFAQTEYRARHILVATQPEAEARIAELNEGADFAELAATHSQDGSATDGGDLGWFPPERMIPAFSAALMTLEPGSYTPEPVATEFGWHVIQLEATRDAAVPPLDAVRTQIEEILQTRALRAYLDDLRSATTVTFPTRPAQ